MRFTKFGYLSAALPCLVMNNFICFDLGPHPSGHGFHPVKALN